MLADIIQGMKYSLDENFADTFLGIFFMIYLMIAVVLLFITGIRGKFNSDTPEAIKTFQTCGFFFYIFLIPNIVLGFPLPLLLSLVSAGSWAVVFYWNKKTKDPLLKSNEKQKMGQNIKLAKRISYITLVVATVFCAAYAWGGSGGGDKTCQVCGRSYSAGSGNYTSISRTNMCSRCYKNYKAAQGVRDYLNQ